MTLNGSSFMVTWTNLKNHLLEVGLIQNQEPMSRAQLLIYSILSFVRIHMNRNLLRRILRRILRRMKFFKNKLHESGKFCNFKVVKYRVIHK